MQKIKAYVKDSYNELMHKVSWPTWAELQESAITVLIATCIIAVVVFLIDFLFNMMLNFIYQMA